MERGEIEVFKVEGGEVGAGGRFGACTCGRRERLSLRGNEEAKEIGEVV